MDFNNIQKNTKRELIQMKHLKPIFIYDPQKKKNRQIHYLTDTKRDFLITLNPLVYQEKDEVKDAFNYCKNRFGKFRYGKNWTHLLNLDFDGCIEKQMGYNHLHLLLRNQSLNEMALLYNHIANTFKQVYMKASTHCKILDPKEVSNSKQLITEYWKNRNLRGFKTPLDSAELNVLGYIWKNEEVEYKTNKEKIFFADNETMFFSANDFIK